MGRMQQNVVILAIQRQENIHRLGTRPCGSRTCKTAKELGSVLQTGIRGFVLKEPRGERLENNFARLFSRHLS